MPCFAARVRNHFPLSVTQVWFSSKRRPLSGFRYSHSRRDSGFHTLRRRISLSWILQTDGEMGVFDSDSSPIYPGCCRSEYRLTAAFQAIAVAFRHQRSNLFSTSSAICFSIFPASALCCAVTLIYTFSFGSVPFGRTSTEPQSVKYFSTSDYSQSEQKKELIYT